MASRVDSLLLQEALWKSAGRGEGRGGGRGIGNCAEEQVRVFTGAI